MQIELNKKQLIYLCNLLEVEQDRLRKIITRDEIPGAQSTYMYEQFILNRSILQLVLSIINEAENGQT